ncbi:glycosyltransferase family protein [Microlunatus parietis]|uniref:Glycosyltransferase involved in cell wall biosynthesis n=1 Tax=Microlunatus parietis TaxID=682979 RepID=A0A7Y9IA80_9ACTN|nr:glycosyl transferase [Microlunatus parietis]NYE72997.1 glycosyltransferase involved in cell wall biosynthesis [Microlunatus parietis]
MPRLTVLQSFPTPRPTTNPYLIMLAERLERTGQVRVLTFGYRTALLGRYDVFQVHWPEILLHGSSPLKKLARQLLAFAFMIRLAITRTPVVRTVHNVERPEGLTRLDHRLLDLMDRLTTLRIRLNRHTPVPAGAPSMIIPHGHYRDWFAGHATESLVPGRIGYVGLIRRYKGVERLLETFAGTDADVTLMIGGQPSTAELAEAITAAAAADARITVVPRFLDDAELVSIVTGSELIVLPYRLMHNSGGTLAALSLNRPVLVPDNEVNRDLADETGPGWVHLFDGELRAEDLITTLDRVRQPRTAEPRLVGRDWPELAAAHLAGYRQAIAIRRAGG